MTNFLKLSNVSMCWCVVFSINPKRLLMSDTLPFPSSRPLTLDLFAPTQPSHHHPSSSWPSIPVIETWPQPTYPTYPTHSCPMSLNSFSWPLSQATASVLNYTPSLKQDEKEKRKAEVRARMEASAQKKKRGFMTPARKKKLRVSSRTILILLILMSNLLTVAM